MANGPYSRVYHELMDEYPAVFRSDLHLGLYVRLLMVADKFYPQHAPVPRRDGAYKSLVSCGLVLEDVGGATYTIRGLSAERERRSEPGRIAAAVRWQRDRNANAMPEEKRREEKETSTTHSANGKSPQTFMGFRPKDPENGAGLWNGSGLHDGRHPECAVCEPLRRNR